MRVSIVIPLFNKEHTLRRALESIARQTIGDWEAIVVDDGSTDNGASLVEESTDPRIRLVRQANGGPGAARNTGWRLGRAPFVAFLDADDEWEPDFLARALERMEEPEERVGLVAFAWWEEPGGIFPEWVKAWTPGLWKARPETPVRELISRLAFCSPCSILIRKELLERYGGFYSESKCRYAEDAHLFLKILLNEAIWFDHEPAARFHREDSGLSGNYKAARPVEPFLTNPDDVRRFCPSPMKALLEQFLAARAMKTALVLGYWGQWKEAGIVRGSFEVEGASKLPWYWTSLLAANAASGWLVGAMGRAHREIQRLKAGKRT